MSIWIWKRNILHILLRLRLICSNCCIGHSVYDPVYDYSVDIHGRTDQVGNDEF